MPKPHFLLVLTIGMLLALMCWLAMGEAEPSGFVASPATPSVAKAGPSAASPEQDSVRVQSAAVQSAEGGAQPHLPEPDPSAYDLAVPEVVALLSTEDSQLPSAAHALQLDRFNPQHKHLEPDQLAELDATLREIQVAVDTARRRAFAARDAHVDLLFALGRAESVPAGQRFPGVGLSSKRAPGDTTAMRNGQGVLFNVLDVPECHNALTEAQTAFAAGVESIRGFVAAHGH